MADYSEKYDESLNHKEDSLLNQGDPLSEAKILDTVSSIPAEMIQEGVIGGLDKTTGIEIRVDKPNKKVYLQSRNFVTGSTGWALDAGGDIEASSGTFRGTLSGATIIGGSIKTATSGNRIELDGTNYFLVYSVGGYYVTQINGDGELVFYANASGNDNVARITGDSGNDGRIQLVVGQGTGGTETYFTFNSSALTSDREIDLGSSTAKFNDLYLAGDVVGGGLVKSFTAADQIDAHKAVALVTIGTDKGKIVEISADTGEPMTTPAVNHFIGFSTESIASGASGKVMCYGVKGGFSGLTIGSVYYIKNTTVVEALGDSQTTQDSDVSYSAANPVYQSFQPNKNMVTAISIYICDADVSGANAHYVYVYEGAFNGTYVGGGTMTADLVGTCGGGSPAAGKNWYKFTFTSPILVIPGNTYFIKIHGSAGLTGATLGYNSAGGYGGGFLSTDGSTPIGDACFKVYEKDNEGEIATAAGTNSKKVGIAVSATEILIKNDN